MKQEPVALVSVRYSNEPYTFSQLKTLPNGTHELYTAPRELSDEEITVIATQGRSDLIIPAHISFARAILKKASEK